jgi:hypothetical protein
MCVVALVVLLVAAVLLVPAIARVIGAAVLILIVLGAVLAFAAPAQAPTIFATDAVTVRAADLAQPTCVSQALPAWLPPAQWRSPVPPQSSPIIVPANTCRLGYESSAMRRCAPDCRHGTCRRVRVAEAQPPGARERPLPVPMYGAGCPSGYSASPTSGTCAPSTTTCCRAFPSNGSCPTGWSYSPTSRMCTETNCR